MMIFTYVKIAALVVVLGVCGYYVWNYHHLQAKVADLKQQVENHQTEIDTIKKAQETTSAVAKKQTTIRRRVTHEQADLDKTVPTVDNAGLYKLYDRYRLHSDSKGDSSPSGRGRGPANPAP